MGWYCPIDCSFARGSRGLQRILFWEIILSFSKFLKTPRTEMRFSQHSGELGIVHEHLSCFHHFYHRPLVLLYKLLRSYSIFVSVNLTPKILQARICAARCLMVKIIAFHI